MRYERDFKYAVSAFLVLFTESALGKYISVSGALPLITFSYIIACAALETDISYSMAISVILGVFSDILFGRGFGINTASYCFAAYCTFKLKDSIFSSKLLFLLLDAFLLTAMQQLFYMLSHIGDIGTAYLVKGFLLKGIPTALYTTVVCCLFYFIGGSIFKKRR